MKKILVILAIALFIAINCFGQTYTYSNGTVITVGKLSYLMTNHQSYGWLNDTTAFLYLPPGYDSSSSRTYPIIEFFHGSGGNGSWQATLSDAGLVDLINKGTYPYAVTSPGDTTWFIVYAPAGGYMETGTMENQIDSDNVYLKNYFDIKIDTTRIYATGLSAGGGTTLYMMSTDSSTVRYAAGVPMSTVWTQDVDSAAYYTDMWLWQLHGNSDNTAIFSIAVNNIDTFNVRHPNQKALLMAYTGGHSGWETYYTPTWIWNAANDQNPTQDIGTYNSKTIYQWMLGYTHGTSKPIPVVNAGSNQTLPIGTTTDTLKGSATSANGKITSYLWTQIYGTTVTIVNPTDSVTAITGLANGDSLVFKLTATDDSNQVGYAETYMKVNSVPDTPDYKIVIDTAQLFWSGDTTFYQVNDLTSSGIVNVLFNDQSPDPLHGVNTPTPTGIFTSGFTSKPYYPAQIVVDLGGFYKLTHEYFYDTFGTDTLNIGYGTPQNWTGVMKMYENAGGAWNDMDDTVYTRYLHIYYSNTGNQKVGQLILYGHLVNDSLSRTMPSFAVPTKTPLTMGNFIGFNEVGPAQVDSVGSLMRTYEEYNWIDTVTTVHNVDSILFVFDKYSGAPNSSSSPLYYFFPGNPNVSPVLSGYYPSDSIQNVWAINNTGEYDAFTNSPAFAIQQGNYKYIDTVETHSYDATNVNNYKRLGRMAWEFAAFYGFEKHPADSMQDPYPTYSGMGWSKYVENQNEENGQWAGVDKYYNPQQFTAYSSAFYDGDLGAMGQRMGIKGGDSTMVVVEGGTAGADTTYYKGLHYYDYYTRSNHTDPFDVVNFHTYPTNGTNASGTTPHAYSPEDYFLNDTQNVIAPFIQFSSILFPGKPIWITEFGYDRNRATDLSVPPINGLDSAQIQAQWVARFWMFLAFSGVQRATIFQLHNDPLGTMYDTLGYTTFNTTGLLDGHYVGNQFSPQYATSWYAYPAYYFQRTLWLKLYNYKPDSIVESNDDSIYVYRYKSVNNPDSIAYAIWSGTQTNRILNNYVLRTGHISTPIEQVTMADKYMDGVDTTKSTDVNGNLPITITESPKLYFTTLSNIGGTLVDSVSSQANIAPTLNVSNQNTTKDTTTITAIAVPGNSPIISYKWTQIGGTSIQFSLPSQNEQGAQVGNLTANQTYTFSVTAMDANGLTATKQVVLSTNNQPPSTGGKVLLYIYEGKLILVQ